MSDGCGVDFGMIHLNDGWRGEIAEIAQKHSAVFLLLLFKKDNDITMISVSPQAHLIRNDYPTILQVFLNGQFNALIKMQSV